MQMELQRSRFRCFIDILFRIIIIIEFEFFPAEVDEVERGFDANDMPLDVIW